jgi:hypothetical protein
MGGVAMLSAAGDGNKRQLGGELDGGARVEVGTWTHSKWGELDNQKRNFDGKEWEKKW